MAGLARPPASLTAAVILGAGLVLAPVAAEPQQTKVARIGLLVMSSIDAPQGRIVVNAFRQGLRERGYVEGQNIVIEYREAGGKIERLPTLAAELARLKLDVIIVTNTPMTRAAQRATSTIPIVATAMGDPVGDGFVASLGRPGGNITGLTFLGPELVPKRLELLKETLPKVSRVAALWHPGAFSESTTKDMVQRTEGAAKILGIKLHLVAARNPDELDQAFATMAKERVGAVIVFPSPMFFNERQRIVDLAAKHRLPAMTNAREFVELGSLISYGASITDLNRRGAIYVDRILNGARPSDLPIEQPSKFELLVNLKTAKTLGLTIPKTVILQADEVIE